jgi:hypothetical protein
MPFIPTIFWCYINFDLNLLSIATEDKSTDKRPEYVKFDETNISFSELLKEWAKKERNKKEAS